MAHTPPSMQRSPDDQDGGLAIDVDQLLHSGESSAVRLRVRGEIDLATIQTLQDSIDHLLDTGVKSLDLDLTEVAFCDVTALNLLLSVDAQLRSRGGQLTVHGPCLHLRLMLRAVGRSLRLLPA